MCNLQEDSKRNVKAAMKRKTQRISLGVAVQVKSGTSERNN